MTTIPTFLKGRQRASNPTSLHGNLWTDDLWFRDGVVHVRTTGAIVPIDADLARDVARWLAFYLPVRVKAALQRLLKPGPRLAFTPHAPRPWYLIWIAAAWAGARFVRDPAKADVVFRFEDQTLAQRSPADVGAINGACLDVSKSKVALVFEAVFGYPLAIDPETHHGLVVEKGEANGVHDGRIVSCPTPRLAGRTYQRLIDNIEEGLSTDLRTPFVGGAPVVVYIKQRPKAARFANMNSRVRLTTPQAVFSPAEIDLLSAFVRAMDLDWGGLDVLRDRADGRIYVVDVNKTDMGPPLALPWLDKLKSTRRIARALKPMLERATA